MRLTEEQWKEFKKDIENNLNNIEDKIKKEILDTKELYNKWLLSSPDNNRLKEAENIIKNIIRSDIKNNIKCESFSDYNIVCTMCEKYKKFEICRLCEMISDYIKRYNLV